MNSRFMPTNLPLLLLVPLLTLAWAAASPAAAARFALPGDQQMESAETQALNRTENQLAILAKIGVKDSASASAAPVEDKNPAKARKYGPSAGATRVASLAPELVMLQEKDGTLVLTQKVSDKDSAPVKKKKVVRKKRVSAKAHQGGGKKKQNVVDRRLTRAEVLTILSTTRDFSGSDLSGMNLKGIDFSGVKFNRANLHLANMERADLAESDLELADLSGADLRGASLIQARFRGTLLKDTQMDGALWVDRTICKKGSVGSCIE